MADNLSTSSSVSTVTGLQEESKLLREMFPQEVLKRQESEARTKILSEALDDRPAFDNLSASAHLAASVKLNASSSTSPSPVKSKDVDAQKQKTSSPPGSASSTLNNNTSTLNKNNDRENNKNNNNNNNYDINEYSKFQSGIQDLDATALGATGTMREGNETMLLLRASSFSPQQDRSPSNLLSNTNSLGVFSKTKRSTSASPQAVQKVESFNATIRPSLSKTLRDGDESPLVKTFATLHFATDSDIAEYMISKGADVNQYDTEGQQPLHAAAQGGRWDVCVTLLVNEADLNGFTKDELEATPLDLAMENLHFEVIALLQSKGALRTAGSFSRMLARGIDDVEFKRLKELHRKGQLLCDDGDGSASPSPRRTTNEEDDNDEKYMLGNVQAPSPPKMSRAGSAPADLLKNNKDKHLTVIDLTKDFKPNLEAARKSSLPLSRRINFSEQRNPQQQQPSSESANGVNENQQQKNTSGTRKGRNTNSRSPIPNSNSNSNSKSNPQKSPPQDQSNNIISPEPKNPSSNNQQNQSSQPSNSSPKNNKFIVSPSNHHNNLDIYYSDLTPSTNPFQDGFYDAAHGRRGGPRIIPDHQESQSVLRRKEQQEQKKKEEQKKKLVEKEQQQQNSSLASATTTKPRRARYDSPTTASKIKRTSSSSSLFSTSSSGINANNNSNNKGSTTSSAWPDSIKVTKGTSAWARSTTQRMPIHIEVARGVHLPMSRVPDRAGGRRSTVEEDQEQERQTLIKKQKELLAKQEEERKGQKEKEKENDAEKGKKSPFPRKISPIRRQKSSATDGRLATPNYRRVTDRVEYIPDKPSTPQEVVKQKQLCDRLSTPKKRRGGGEEMDDSENNNKKYQQQQQQQKKQEQQHYYTIDDNDDDYSIENPPWNPRPFLDLSPSHLSPPDRANPPRMKKEERREQFEKEREEFLARKKAAEEERERMIKERARMIREHEMEVRQARTSPSNSPRNNDDDNNNEDRKLVEGERPPWNPRNKLDPSPSLFSSDHLMMKNGEKRGNNNNSSNKPSSLFIHNEQEPSPAHQQQQEHKVMVSNHNEEESEQQQQAVMMKEEDIPEMKSLHQPSSTTTRNGNSSTTTTTTRTLRGREVMTISFGSSSTATTTTKPPNANVNTLSSRHSTPTRVQRQQINNTSNNNNNKESPFRRRPTTASSVISTNSPTRRVSSPNIASKLALGGGTASPPSSQNRDQTKHEMTSGDADGNESQSRRTMTPLRQQRIEQVSYLTFGRAPFQPNNLPVQRASAYYSPKRRTSTPVNISSPLDRPRWQK